MKKDIASREDIRKLVELFYGKVKSDKDIGYFFNTVSNMEWSDLLAVMTDFWENVLFYSGTYDGNPMQVHRSLHAKSPMNLQQFQHWNRLFDDTVDELFAGENAEIIKQRAQNISTVLQVKLFG